MKTKFDYAEIETALPETRTPHFPASQRGVKHAGNACAQTAGRRFESWPGPVSNARSDAANRVSAPAAPVLVGSRDYLRALRAAEMVAWEAAERPQRRTRKEKEVRAISAAEMTTALLSVLCLGYYAVASPLWPRLQEALSELLRWTIF